ncbi:hypothetical protein [Spartinivicinus poritis]|uniref:Uncharacterized protein n=1 Tax=Spartinivicinus poritis TaxID=2994640 RepID=A0ABT5UF84_9GAMM|nr:hypothetical protein [Spartinivicinus sp. A2-2]MDE1465041.1 hypothetical protein [Spartinivicinus sp. A2-2]
MNNLKNTENTNEEVRSLTEEEVLLASGGACRTELKVTYRGGEKDAEAVLVCDF